MRSGGPGMRWLTRVCSSDRLRELCECCGGAERRRDIRAELVVAAAEVLHERMAGGNSCR